MAKKYAGRERARSGRKPAFDAGEKETLRQLSDLFVRAKFEVQERFAFDPDGMPDLEVSRYELWTHRRYAIRLVLVAEAEELWDKLTELQEYATSLRTDEYDEYWLVSNLSVPERPSKKRFIPSIRALTIKEVERMLLGLDPTRRRGQSKARTRIGKAALSNEKEIQLAIAGLILQVDAKLEILRDQRPNDPETQVRTAAEISDFERMKAELENIREAVAGFKKQKVPEKDVVKSVDTFGDSVKEMWNKHREGVLATTGKTALFVSAVGVLALFGGNTATAVAVAGAIIQPSILGGLKKLAKKLPGS